MKLKKLVKVLSDTIYQIIKDHFGLPRDKIICLKINNRSNKFRKHYQDDISLKILKTRQKFNLSNAWNKDDRRCFLDFQIENAPDEISIPEFDASAQKYAIVCEFDRQNKLKYKYNYLYLKRLLNHLNKNNSVRCIWEKGRTNIVESEEIIIPVGSKSFCKTIENRFSKTCKILTHQYESIIGCIGSQYCDVFDPIDGEIIVDAGACTGETALEFLKWGGERIKTIYSFESDPQNIERCKEFIKGYCDDRVKLIEKGCWDETKNLSIVGNSGTPGSSVGEGEENHIEVTTIDEIVKDERVTFIKMDIEGAEIPALRGASKCIIRNKPRLAVCVYHKDDDIYTIPEYLLSLVPEYRFYLRHYTTWDWETVLYAYVP